ncbi:HsmA family protein [Pelosinus propionicus]|uniref:TIGR03987 family protein n=1 Tax=Pelosinus propionicus DSM 13327 TaxID=1123291 RepID=A0A1I4IC58_9FIRM|nr:HsmA family protein [Pelosinus propionicus]SFL51341.1 TIGR03987 family protein [Pelosinus propionicus DSM 13327]
MSYGVLFINCAFVLYTVGVWSEKIQGNLKRGHLVLFWLGIVCDVLGTAAMGEIAKGHVAGMIPITSEFHSLTGIIALLLMLVHTCWATVIIAAHKESWIRKFHRYSLMVWLIWLLPFISGAIVHFP